MLVWPGTTEPVCRRLVHAGWTGSRSAPGGDFGHDRFVGLDGPDASVTGSQRRSRVGFALGQNAGARSACAVIVGDGFTPRLALIAGTVDDGRSGMAIDAPVGVDHAGLRRVAIRRPPMWCAVEGMVSTSMVRLCGSPPTR